MRGRELTDNILAPIDLNAADIAGLKTLRCSRCKKKCAEEDFGFSKSGLRRLKRCITCQDGEQAATGPIGDDDEPPAPPPPCTESVTSRPTRRLLTWDACREALAQGSQGKTPTGLELHVKLEPDCSRCDEEGNPLADPVDMAKWIAREVWQVTRFRFM